MATPPMVFMSMSALVLSAALALPAVAVMATLPLRFIYYHFRQQVGIPGSRGHARRSSVQKVLVWQVLAF
jgi:hypothetical protein